MTQLPLFRLRLPVGIKSIELELTLEEYAEAIRCALKRHQRAIEKHRKGGNHQAPERSLADHQIGCLGERANLKYKGLPLSVMDFYPDDLRAQTHGAKPADIGNVEVRAHRKKGKYLLIQDYDPRDRFYVSASADIGDRRVTLCGWIHGTVATAGGRSGPWWSDGPHHGGRWCYWYPDENLEPMSSCP